ncbi:hypothetical protein CSOJ01_14605 [Colletotrichum sojae]|uniref:Uncharacterized protein n=1 Tax=Colletotrichum sojae TaxID=2175907 RepID=A0A8H6MIV8_9PEZI|nr:hypothetical protein CSOJ01_14605 [Colletotrichum sojae]
MFNQQARGRGRSASKVLLEIFAVDRAAHSAPLGRRSLICLVCWAEDQACLSERRTAGREQPSAKKRGPEQDAERYNVTAAAAFCCVAARGKSTLVEFLALYEMDSVRRGGHDVTSGSCSMDEASSSGDSVEVWIRVGQTLCKTDRGPLEKQAPRQRIVFRDNFHVSNENREAQRTEQNVSGEMKDDSREKSNERQPFCFDETSQKTPSRFHVANDFDTADPAEVGRTE